MKKSAVLIRAAGLLVLAGSLLCSAPFAVSSDVREGLRQKRVFDPPSEGGQRFPSGTVIPPTLPPGGVFVPLEGNRPRPKDEESRHRPKEYQTKPPNYGQQYGWQSGRDDAGRRDKEYRKHKYKYKSYEYPRSYTYRRPPADAFSFYITGVPFFYHSGTYYRQHRDEYVVVPAPVGARIRVLPDGCSTLYTRGYSYYVCDDDYYRQDDGGYIVIERPVYVYRDADVADVAIGEEVRVQVDVLNVRSGPGTGYDIVTQLYLDDIVPVRGKKQNWYFIDSPDGTRGWIMSRYVELYRGRHGGDG